MTNARPVTVADMLDARDRRAERQKRFLETSPVLICLTMNIPGPIKASTEILAAFDRDERKCGLAHFGKPIYGVDTLKSFCDENHPEIGILTVPESNAQIVCDELTACGIKRILNFSPVILSVPKDVKVNNVNVAASLAVLLAK